MPRRLFNGGIAGMTLYHIFRKMVLLPQLIEELIYMAKEQLFFIALLPPAKVQREATKIKEYFAKVYTSKAALKSPPHITLQPPFKWNWEDVPILTQHLQQFAETQAPIPLGLDGFGSFRQRVIYINVIKTPELVGIYQQLQQYLEDSLAIVDEMAKTRLFAPHLTVAYRDLTRDNFRKAWPEFAAKKFCFEFIIPQLTLLLHNGKQWQIYQDFKFCPV
jgi:2'-5' RNA ligase